MLFCPQMATKLPAIRIFVNTAPSDDASWVVLYD